jgi:hypothetical protein
MSVRQLCRHSKLLVSQTVSAGENHYVRTGAECVGLGWDGMCSPGTRGNPTSHRDIEHGSLHIIVVFTLFGSPSGRRTAMLPARHTSNCLSPELLDLTVLILFYHPRYHFKNWYP